MDRQVGQARHRPIKPDQTGVDAARCPYAKSAGQAEIPVGEGGQDRSAVDFNAQPEQSVAAMRALGLQPQARRVGVRADDAEPGRRRVRPTDPEGDEGRCAADDVMLAFGLQAPGIPLVQGRKTRPLQPACQSGPGVPWAGTGVDEIQQVLGVAALFRGGVHERFLYLVNIDCMVTESFAIAPP